MSEGAGDSHGSPAGGSGPRKTDQTILVAYDFSPHSKAALAKAVEFARLTRADLHLLHVVQPPIYTYAHGTLGGGAPPPPIDTGEIRAAAARSLHEVAGAVEGAPGRVESHVVEAANIADVIRETAEKLSADLIVMGTHGRTGITHVFLGSVAERTLRRAPCPVLTVQAPDEAEEE